MTLNLVNAVWYRRFDKFSDTDYYKAATQIIMKQRRELDFKRFAQMADNQSNLIQMITGMQEIKLNNCEKQKHWDWKKIQAKLFRVILRV